MTQNSNTAKYSLVRTTESSSNDNIPQNNGVVNNNSMQKSLDDAENTKYNSVITKVITFNSEYEDENLFAKEVFLDAEKEQSSLEIATIIVETVEGQGYVTISNIGDYSTDGREDGRGKGKNSGRTSSTDEIKFSIVSDVIEKHGGLSELIRKYG